MGPAADLVLTDRVVELRGWRADDAPALHEAARESLATVGRWLPWLHADYGLEDSVRWLEHAAGAWERGEEYAFAVRDVGSGRLLGGVGRKDFVRRDRMANLGWWVRASAERRGIATRAGRLAARWALTEGGFGRVEILMQPDNAASEAVARKLGATFEGMRRDRIWHGERCFPAHAYSLVRADVDGGI